MLKAVALSEMETR